MDDNSTMRGIMKRSVIHHESWKRAWKQAVSLWLPPLPPPVNAWQKLTNKCDVVKEVMRIYNVGKFRHGFRPSPDMLKAFSKKGKQYCQKTDLKNSVNWERNIWPKIHLKICHGHSAFWEKTSLSSQN